MERMWAARDVGLVVARQNGKGSILEARELAGLFLPRFSEKTIIHSAQDFATSGEHFRRVAALIQDTPVLNKQLKGAYEANGKERIELKNGARLLFKTRTKKLGRGFSPQLVVLDEAMFLDNESMMALRPTLSAQPNPQLFFTGSAGLEDAYEFGMVRQRALKALESGDLDPYLFFAEWSADVCNDFCVPGCDEHDSLDDEEVWAKTNPGYGIRISYETVDNERRADPGGEAFKVERLSVGRWPVQGDQWSVIDEKAWQARLDENSEVEASSIKVLAVDVSPNREFSAVAVCGSNGTCLHVEITSDELSVDHRPGVDWVVRRVKEIWDRVKPDAVVVDKVSQAGSLVDQLEHQGVTVISPTTAEYAQGCGQFFSGVQPRRGEVADIVHIGQPTLNSAVAGADKRMLADKWAWDKKTSASDITPLVAATLAAWGYRKILFEKPKAATPFFYAGLDDI
ncbi:terminase [Streptomyces sp. NPDC057854]|uniref:terminase n=1 Tax=unclassified Streptomyces TaxID=2593676 RepID=UPI00368F5ADF